MVELTFVRDTLALPPLCACCLAPTKSNRRIFKRQLENTWGRTGVRERNVRIPFCDECSRHVDWKTGGGTFGVVLAFIVYTLLFGLFAFLLVAMWSISNDVPKGSVGPQIVAISAAVIGAALFAYRRFARRPTKPVGTGHTALGECVQLIRHDDDYVGLRVQNDAWAERARAARG